MATKSRLAEEMSNQPPARPAIPQGFERRNEGDVQGIWDPTNPGCSQVLQFVPKSRNVMDNQADPTKVSTFIMGKLLEDASLIDPDDADKKAIVEVKKGELIGLWYSAGMKDIETCFGLHVFMFRGEDVSMKPLPDGTERSPMRSFEIHVPRGSAKKTIPIGNDSRRMSKKGNRPESDEDVPF